MMAIWRAYQRMLQRLEEKVFEENLGGLRRRAEGGRESGHSLCRAGAADGGFGEVMITDAPDYQASQRKSEEATSHINAALLDISCLFRLVFIYRIACLLVHSCCTSLFFV